MENFLSTLVSIIKKHEGISLTAYTDTTGHLTIGYGREISKHGISLAEAEHLLANDITRVSRELTEALPWFDTLDEVRKIALIDMAFNLGTPGLLKFKRTLQALAEKRWTLAGEYAKDSLWAKQVPNRARDIIKMLVTGQMPE